jgi:hypothetical protein
MNENIFLSLLLIYTVWETARPNSNLGPTCKYLYSVGIKYVTV